MGSESITLCPEDRAALLELLADRIMAKLEAEIDFPALITLPLDAVAQCIGLGTKQTARVLPTRAMGDRKLGVSLRAVIDYQATPHERKKKPARRKSPVAA